MSRNSKKQNILNRDTSNYLKERLLNEIKNLDSQTFQEIFEKISQKTDSLPLSIFNNDIFSLNETIIKYLHENLSYSFTKIAKLSSKSPKTVWQLYQNSKKKSIVKIKPIPSAVNIPISILCDSNLSTLELVVKFLYDEIGMSYSKIATALHRNYKTIWTVYQKGITKEKKKLGGLK